MKLRRRAISTNFSRDVMARIRAGEDSRAANVSSQLPWLFRLISTFEVKPAFAGGFASVLCLLLLLGIVYAERPDGAPQQLLQAAEISSPLAAAPSPGFMNPMAAAEQPVAHSVSSTNPVFNAQPVSAAWFGSPIRDGATGHLPVAVNSTPLLTGNACALETPCVFLFNQASASQNHRGRQPKRRRGQDHHRRQPRRLPRRRRPARAALRPRPAGQRHQRPRAWKKPRAPAPIASCSAKAACWTKSSRRPSSGSKSCPAKWICAPPTWNWRGWRITCCGSRNRSSPFWTATGSTGAD